jgi:cephalosporin-C deacetylase-like acetyl esterase
MIPSFHQQGIARRPWNDSFGEQRMRLLATMILTAMLCAGAAIAAPRAANTQRGDRMIAEYFRAETAALADRCLADIHTLDDWTARRAEYRRQLFEMLGLDPLPERTDLKQIVTGRVDHPEFTVENIQFQSRPGLYVTANLYLPKKVSGPVPAILYVCGHAQVVQDGVAYGSKVSYQHHPGWFARNGYACLILDTLQLGEIAGIHHGLHREKMWWWSARGYTPAGVEAWNCIRALDYLQSRPEIDGSRIGVTGRSGGGAYSWWIAALDDRIRAAVPVAGITDLENHVVDGCVEGHCDCMFMVHTYRWDYAQVAALVAPRPLLIGNSDKDSIFPLEGVVRLHAKVRRIYQLYGAADKLGLLITEGPHKDTQDLQVPALRWFNRFLRQADPLVETAAVKLFEPRQLKVFATLPADALNGRIHDTFVPLAPPPSVPASAAAWERQRDGWLTALREKAFRGWPAEPGALDAKPVFSVARQGIRFSAVDFTSEPHIRLRLYLAQRDGLDRPERVVLQALDEDGWSAWLAAMRPGFAQELSEESLPDGNTQAFAALRERLHSHPETLAFVAPRGIGPTAWDADERKQTHIRRRFVLLGQTLDGMRVWDIRRAVQALRSLPAMKDVPVELQGERQMAGVALYAALFEPQIARLDLRRLPPSHHDGPIFLNVLRFLDMPQAVAMAAERIPMQIESTEKGVSEFAMAVGRALGWKAEQVRLTR